MAELHGELYFKHSNLEIMDKLNTLFYDSNGDGSLIIDMARSINPANGENLAEDILNSVDEPEHDLSAEFQENVAGYSVLSFTHGADGDEIMENLVLFLYQLVPDIHAQAWGCGDDDPWEFWFKYEDGNVARKDDEPFEDDEQDEQIRSSVYDWWHQDMPDEIAAGFLNEEDDDEDGES